MAAVTRLGLYGGSRSPYSSFAGKTPGVLKSYTKTFTRLGLYGGTRTPYGSFAGKVPPPVAPVVPSTKGGRVKRVKRYVVEIEGNLFEVANIAEAESVLQQVRDLAQVSAEKDVTTPVAPKPPRVSIRTVSGNKTTSQVLQREVKKTQSVINRAYTRAAQAVARDTEISELLIKKIVTEDEEDAILALLL